MNKTKKLIAKAFEMFFLLGVPIGISLGTFYNNDVQDVGFFGKFGAIGLVLSVIIFYAVYSKKIKPFYVQEQQILSVHKADFEKAVNDVEKDKLQALIAKRKRKLTVYNSISLGIIMTILYASVSYISAMAGQLESIIGFSILSMTASKVIQYKWDTE